MTIRPGDWSRAICVASGDSLSVEQCREAAKAQRCGWRIFAVNDNWRRVPSADVLYACDRKWWAIHYQAIEASGFRGEKWTQVRPELTVAKWNPDLHAAKLLGLHHVASTPDGAPREKGAIRRGGNSGLQTIDLAASIFGARTLIMIGYDMQNTNGRAHWFGDHAKPLRQADNPGDWIPAYDAFALELAAEGVRVINATAQTALRCFDRMPLEDAIQSFRAAA